MFIVVTSVLEKYSVLRICFRTHWHGTKVPGYLMATYNLQYRGGKLKPGVRDGLLTIARAARKPRLPRHSSQSKENNEPLDTTTCMEPLSCTVNEPESNPVYFFRARTSIHRPKPQHHLASRDLLGAMHNDATVDSPFQP